VGSAAAAASGAAAIAIDGGDLPVGGGLLSLLRPALLRVPPGGVVAVLSRAPSVSHDLPSFCRLERHAYLSGEPVAEGTWRHLVERGELGAPRPWQTEPVLLPPGDGRLTTTALLQAAPFPERADPGTGFAPRGAQVEPGGPTYPFTLTERSRVAPPEVAQLYDQAVAAQWDATRDIPWGRVGVLAPPLEQAVGQVMTFLAENELAALYVPARFVPRIHPAYVEVAQFLASQMADEARHIDVFLKRARLGGTGAGPGVSSVVTSRSLLALLELDDFTEAAFLLSVLGEGTFLDLLRFVEDHAPDEATAELCRRARNDETRHVHFGLVHVRHALASDAEVVTRLEAAVGRRAQVMGASTIPAPLWDALVVLAARGTEPAAVARGHEAVRELVTTMDEARRKRLERAGFSAEQAARLSGLHTPNFM
jgi:hypothetical protein